MSSVGLASVFWLVLATAPQGGPPGAEVASPVVASAASAPVRLSFPTPRRPARLVVVSAVSFAVGSALSFVTPIASNCDSPYRDYPYGDGCRRGAVLGLVVGSALFDATALVTAGLAGRGYGNRYVSIAGPRRRSPVGHGIVLVVIGGVTTLGATFMPMLVGETDPYDYPMIGVRQTGVLIGAWGAAMIGYGLALRTRRVVVRPTLSATQVGLAVGW